MAWKPDYASLSEARDHLRISDAAFTADDAEIAKAITAASRMVDTECHRQFGNVGSTDTTRYYTAYVRSEDGAHAVSIDDLYDNAALVVASDGAAITDYTLRPFNAEADGVPYVNILFGGTVSLEAGAITVTSAKWGWSAVPAAAHSATLLQMARIIKRRDAPFGVAGSPDMGNELRLLAQMDPDAKLLCASIRRYWG